MVSSIHTPDRFSQKRGTDRNPAKIWQSGLAGSTLPNRSSSFDLMHPDPELRSALQDHPFGDRVKIAAVPMVITHAERLQLERACKQYVKALSYFFQDVVLGSGKILDHPRGVPSVIVDAILAASPIKTRSALSALWKNRTINDLTFALGPDIAPDKDRKFHLLELNFETLGGVADMHFVPQKYLELARGRLLPHNQLERVIWNSAGPGFFLDSLGRSQGINLEQDCLLNVSQHRGSGCFVTDAAQGKGADLEYCRWSDSLRVRGVTPVWSDAEIAPLLDQARLVVNSSSHALVERWWRDGGGVLLNPPGVRDLLDSKLLLAYLNQIITFYLGESPLIPVPESGVIEICPSSSGGIAQIWTVGRLRTLVNLPSVLDHGLVIKSGRGLCGDEVKIWPPGSRPRLSELQTAIPGFFSEPGVQGRGRLLLKQRFIEILEIDSSRVDLRPLTYCVGGGECVVAPTPIGRAQRVAARRSDLSVDSFKNNVAKGASILPVLAL